MSKSVNDILLSQIEDRYLVPHTRGVSELNNAERIITIKNPITVLSDITWLIARVNELEKEVYESDRLLEAAYDDAGMRSIYLL